MRSAACGCCGNLSIDLDRPGGNLPAVVAVQGSTAGIGSGFPVNIQNGVATVNADITGPRLKNLHNTLNPQAPQDELAVIANYGAVISDMITLADQVAQGVSDASLTSDVRAFNALALAKEQLSQQRALLNYSFSNPGATTPGNVAVDPNTELALQIASQEEFSDESAFQQQFAQMAQLLLLLFQSGFQVARRYFAALMENFAKSLAFHPAPSR